MINNLKLLSKTMLFSSFWRT